MSFKNTALLVFIIYPALMSFPQSVKQDSFYVANWNLENFYDTENDTLTDDEEFLPESVKNWNLAKYEQKIDNLVKVINYMNNGCGPDILAMEEVENINVLKQLIYKMRDRDYIVVHRNSPDLRGIDVAMIYDRDIFKIDSVETLRVELPDGKPTRDILHTVLINRKNHEKIDVYVNHWPSRRGGEQSSNINRITAASVLKNSLNSLSRQSERNAIILGDFNDEPDNESVEKILGAINFDCINSENSFLFNLSYRKFLEKQGSYLYSGKFEMIDQIIISSDLLDGKGSDYDCGSFEIIKPFFMIYQEGKRKGGAIPTYEGKNYIGGYSDHFPVGAKFRLKGKNENK